MPADQLAVAESGATKGQPYLPVMPPFTKDVLSDAQIDAIGDYLATLNEPAGPRPGDQARDARARGAVRSACRRHAVAGRR